MYRRGQETRHPISSRVMRLLGSGILLLVPAMVSAAVLGGSLQTTLYIEESRADAGAFESRVDSLGRPVPSSALPELENRARLLQSVRLDALELGLPRLSFHTAVTAGNVLTDQSLGETRFRLYRAYVQHEGARTAPVRHDLKLGRHWVLAGVGSGAIDGLSARLGRAGIGEATGFYGTLGTDRIARTDRFWSLDSPDDSRAYGGRLRLQREIGPFDPRVSVSWVRADRTPHSERVPDLKRFGATGELRLSRGTGTSHSILRGLRAYGDLRRDRILKRNLSTTAGLGFDGGPRDLSARLEFQVRRAQLSASSFFSSFNSKPVEELRGGAGASLGRGLRLDLDGSLMRFSEEEDDAGLGVTLSGYDLTLGYRFHSGWGGDLSGLVLYGHRRLGEKLTIDAAVDHSRFKYPRADATGQPEEREDDATAGLLALDYRLRPSLSVTGQVEGLANPERKHDLRFLGMLRWRFRTAL